jgi:hypothetical protein
MKYLKRFEGVNDIIDLNEIEELFYPISDENINIIAKKDTFQIIKFDKPIMYFNNIENSKNNMCEINPKIHYLDQKELIAVIITKGETRGSSILNRVSNRMDIVPFEEDLKFAIRYIEDEKNLFLKQVYVARQELYKSNYPTNLFYKDLDTLLKDEIARKTVLSLALYFGE